MVSVWYLGFHLQYAGTTAVFNTRAVVQAAGTASLLMTTLRAFTSEGLVSGSAWSVCLSVGRGFLPTLYSPGRLFGRCQPNGGDQQGEFDAGYLQWRFDVQQQASAA